MKSQFFGFIKYHIKPRHWKGFGIHSPFVFEFVHFVLHERLPFYSFAKIEAWRNSLRKSKVTINTGSWGVGSKKGNNTQKRISSIVQHAAIPKKYGQLLFRIVARYKPRNILELGTSLGISTLYLSLPNSKAQVVSLEGSSALAEMAMHSFQQLNVVNTKVIEGDFDETLPKAIKQLGSLDLLFVDGNHQKEATLRYFKSCLSYANNDSIFIFDDINWSKEMKQAWKEIVHHPQVTVSIDLFRIGIIFFRKESKKQHFTIRF